MTIHQLSPPSLRLPLLMLLCALLLGACHKNSGASALETEAQNKEAKTRAKSEDFSIEGTWIVDVIATYAQEFADEHPEVLKEFAHAFRNGYTVGEHALQFRGASYGAQHEFNIVYDVVERTERTVLLRVKADEDDPEAQSFLSDATHFEFQFDTPDRATIIIWHQDDAPNPADDEVLSALHVKKVSQEAFDAHFDFEDDEFSEPAGQELFSQAMENAIKESGQPAPDLQESLAGSWILDAAQTAKNLYGFSEELHPFMYRFTPIFVQFRPDGSAYWGHIDAEGKDTMETAYRVVRYTYEGEEYTLVEFTHEANDVRPAYATYMRVDRVRDDLVALAPLFMLEQLPYDDTQPLFQRVDQAAFARYTEQDPSASKVDARTQRRAAQRLHGTWVRNTDVTHSDASTIDVAIGLLLQTDQSFELYAQSTENSYQGASTIHEQGTYRILDVEGDHLLVSLRFDDETLSNELVFEFLDANTLRGTEPLSENRSFEAAARDVLYLERTDDQKFRSTFGDAAHKTNP